MSRFEQGVYDGGRSCGFAFLDVAAMLHRRWVILALALTAGLASALGYAWSRGAFTSEAGRRAARDAAWEHARQALAAGLTERAETIATGIIESSPGDAPARLMLGEIALARNELVQAVEQFDLVPLTAGSDHERALLLGAAACLADDRLHAAETRLQTLVRLSPANADAHRKLARLYVMTGRRWDSQAHLEFLVRNGSPEIEQLLMLGDPDSVIDFSTDLARAARREPNDPLPLVGLARIARKQGETEEAARLIRSAVALVPADLQTQATLGQWLVETDPPAVAAWQASLPPGWNSHPDIWAVLAEHAERQKKLPEAIRCYGEVVSRHPNHRRAVYRLGQLLVGQGKAEQGEALLERARLLDELIAVVDVLLRQSESATHLLRAAEITERLGRPWEAEAWYARLAARPDGSRYLANRDRVRGELRADAPFHSVNPLGDLDLAAYPLPQSSGSTAASAPFHSDSIRRLTSNQPLFRDIAGELGLQFTYVSGDDPTVPGWELVHELGGGVGVLDYDRDGWPDLYFTQGLAGFPSSPPAAQSTDRLLRNIGGTAAQDVTDLARLVDFGYGQGVAAGDIDHDGFPDLYVANLGVNRLYRNLGDGTFVDVTDEAGISGSLWTSSCAIADLNGDGFTDLFDATYLAGNEPLFNRCVARGIHRACSPDQFAGEQDRLWINQGDGTFIESSVAAGIDGENGKGLGVLIADLSGGGKLGIFVANDGTPNHYYVNQAASGQPTRFVEQGMTSGLALDGEGRSQACMGIAFDDCNHDGRWDLLVTNFHREGSTYYRQLSGELFEDATSEVGLTAPSLPFTGFGAQFVDAELDGHPDLVVLNGHIEDFRHQDVPFQMRPQLFRNLGDGQFAEAPLADLGEYFRREQLGRALATLDWDRDGKPDLVATHLDFPAALLHNETATSGGFLRVRLVGTASSRDAIGAVVSATTTEGKTYRKQLAAGDGFQASNERSLLFGLGDATRLAELHVRWPSGTEHRWPDVPANQELVLRETGELVPLAGDASAH